SRTARRRQLWQLRSLDQAETGDTEIYQLNFLLAGIVVAEGAQMRGMEGVDQAAEKARVDLAGGCRDAYLHGLAGVTNVGLARDADAGRRNAVALERHQRIALEPGTDRRNRRDLDRVLMHDFGDDVVGAPVHRQEAEGGEIAGI